MAITARELVFYVRAEDQASRVVKRVASSFGSLATIRSLENKGILQQAANLRAVDKAQQSIARNQVTLQRAQVQASRLSRFAGAGKAIPGYTAAETAQLSATAIANVSNLKNQEKILSENLDEVRRSGAAASAAIDQQVSQAKIDRVRSYANEVQNLGRVLRLVGVIGVAAFGFAAHAAANFSTQVALAASQARPIGAPAGAALPIQAKIQEQILQQMQKFPATSQEMANSFYQIFSGTNIQGVKQAAADVKLFNEAAVAGGASLDEMTQAGISIKNVFGIGVTGEFKNMTQALNVFFSAVRYGRMTASQFAQALGYISPIAKDVHLSFESIAQDMAFFTRQTGGNMTRQDAQGLARLIQLLARNDVTAGLASKGIPVFDKLTGKMRPVVDIIKQIHDRLKLTPQETINFFKTISAAGGTGRGTQGTIQAIRIFSQGIQNVKAYQDVVQHVKKDNDEFINSYNQLSKAPGIRWQTFVNQIKAAILVIGGQAIPAFVKLGEPIARLIKWFNGLSDSTKHWIATVGVFGSVGLAIVGTLLVIIGSVGRLILTLKELKLLSLGSEAGFASTKFALFGGVLGILLLVLIKYPHIFTSITQSLGGLKNTVNLVGVAFASWKLAGLATSLLSIGTAAVTAEGEVAALSLSIIGLQALVAAPIVLTVLLAYEVLKGPRMHEIVKTGTDQGLYVGDDGKLRLVTRTANRGPSAIQVKGLTSAQAAKYGKAIDNINRSAGFTGKGVDTLPPDIRNQNRTAGFTGTGSDVTVAAQAAVAKLANWNSKTAIAQVLALYNLTQKAPSQENFKRYYIALAALRAHYTGTDLQALDSYLSAIESATKKSSRKVADAAKAAAAALKQQLKDAASNVMSMYDTLLQQNQSVMGQLFQGPYVQSGSVQNVLQYGGALSGSDLLKDLQSQNTQFTKFYKTIDRLKKRGAPSSLIQQLIQAGPQALPAIKALSGMGDQQWKIYIKTFNRGQALLHSQTIDQLKSQLKDYRKYGRSIALQIITGMRDKRLGLANEIQAIIKNMFGINTPVVTKATKKKLADASKAAATKPGRTPHGTYTGSTTHTHPVVGTRVRTTQGVTYNYNVTAPTSEHTSVETQLRHAEFASRTKYKGHH